MNLKIFDMKAWTAHGGLGLAFLQEVSRNATKGCDQRFKLIDEYSSDFNVQPSEVTYRLMTGAKLSEEQIEALKLSTVVHASCDEARRNEAKETDETGNSDGFLQSISGEGGNEEGEKKIKEEEYAQPEGDDDKILKSTRPARPSDELLSLKELQAAYHPWNGGKILSVYGIHYGRLKSEAGNFFGERMLPTIQGKGAIVPADDGKDPRIGEGYFEPAYTNGVSSLF